MKSISKFYGGEAVASNLEYYKIFYYVAKYSSFTRAAGILMSSQPSVSRTIKLLEQDLGCTLFTRTQKGVTLTPEGLDLYQHIRVAYEEILAGEALLKRECGLEEGSIQIGANETALHCFLFEKLEPRNQDPNSELHHPEGHGNAGKPGNRAGRSERTCGCGK